MSYYYEENEDLKKLLDEEYERISKMPPDERHYVALARIDTELKALRELSDERHRLDKEDHKRIMTILDDIRTHLEMCPIHHSRIEELDRKITSNSGWIKTIVVMGLTLTLAIVGFLIKVGYNG